MGRRPGGRTARTREAVHQACVRLLATHGALGFGIEDVAVEAGVHKTTVYRRWRSIADLLGEVARDLIDQDVPIPDEGTVAADLHAIGHTIANLIRHRVHGAAMTALFTAPATMTDVDEAIRTFWARRLDQLSPVVERAAARGELPEGTDPAQLFESLGAPLYYRLLITRQPIDDDAVERAVAVTLAAARSGLFLATG